MFLSHYLGVYISEISYWRPLTFQLGGDAMGNAPTFLLAIDMNLSQFQDFVCQNACASGVPPRTPLGGLQRPPDPQLQSFGSRKNDPPPFRNPGYGPVKRHINLRTVAKLKVHAEFDLATLSPKSAATVHINTRFGCRHVTFRP